MTSIHYKCKFGKKIVALSKVKLNKQIYCRKFSTFH